MTWTEAEDDVISNGRNDSPPLSHHAVIAGLLTNRSKRQVGNRWDVLKRQKEKKLKDKAKGIVSNRAKWTTADEQAIRNGKDQSLPLSNAMIAKLLLPD